MAYDPTRDEALDRAVARWLAAPPTGLLEPRPVLDHARAGRTLPFMMGRGLGGHVAALDFDAAGGPAAKE